MYLTEFDANAVDVNGREITLDKTAFYPFGGGQPSDSGKLTIKGKSYNIIELKKVGNDIVHISDTDFDSKPGDSVHGSIDSGKRLAYMRHHTAIHIMDAVIEKGEKPGKLMGGMMYQDRAHFDVDMPELNRETAQLLIDKGNKIVSEGHNVVARFIGKEEAMKIPDLSRTEPGRELIKQLDTIRIVEIEGIDAQADGGLHVRNTNEVGTIRLSKFDNKGSHRKRIEITLENKQNASV